MVSAAVASGRFGSAVSMVGKRRTVETNTKRREAQRVLPEPKMPCTQREVKSPWMPQSVESREGNAESSDLLPTESDDQKLGHLPINGSFHNPPMQLTGIWRAVVAVKTHS